MAQRIYSKTLSININKNTRYSTRSTSIQRAQTSPFRPIRNAFIGFLLSIENLLPFGTVKESREEPAEPEYMEYIYRTKKKTNTHRHRAKQNTEEMYKTLFLRTNLLLKGGQKKNCKSIEKTNKKNLVSDRRTL